MTHIDVNVLGSFDVLIDGEPIDVGSTKTEALLAYVAVEAGQTHERRHLANLLWPTVSDRKALRSLRQSLYHLRKTMGSLVDITRTTVTFADEHTASVDLHRFLAALDDGAQERAVEEYSGDMLSHLFLEDCIEYEEWLLVKREQMRRRVLEALDTLAEQALGEPAYERAQEFAHRQLVLEPWREKAHRQLMYALALSGKRSAALAQYQTCRDILDEELGVQPGPETTALYERISAGELTQSVRTTEPAMAKAKHVMPPHSLPEFYTPFIGREQRLAYIHAQIATSECRLLTIAGAGGVGKTRLAVQVASEQLHRQSSDGPFCDGIIFVPLTGIEAPAGESPEDDLANTIAGVVASVLDVPLDAKQSPHDQLFQHLREKRMLLVMDNWEHVRAGAGFLEALFAAAPDVTVLATSRILLDVPQEWAVALDGLSVPADADEVDADSVRLFAQAARRSKKDFALEAGTVSAVAEICRLVEGSPLAIELAATWVQEMTCAEIVQRLHAGLDIEAGDAEERPARHRSLHAVFEHSWRLLTFRQQRILVQLSVFQGDFSRQAAVTVTEADMMDLTALVLRFMLRRTQAGRYEMHALLRQFAAAKRQAGAQAAGLTSDTVHQPHSEYYLTRVASYGDDLVGPAPKQARDALLPDHDNLRAAWRWAVQHDEWNLIEASVDALVDFYEVAGLLYEGTQSFAYAVDVLRTHADAETSVLVRTLLAYGTLLRHQAHFGEAIAVTREAVDVAARSGSARLQAEGAQTLGWIMSKQGRQQPARKYFARALAYAEKTGDRRMQASALLGRATVLWQAGELQAGLVQARESLDLHRDLHYRAGEASAHEILGHINAALGDRVGAGSHYTQALDIVRELDDRIRQAHLLQSKGIVADHRGDYGTARDYYRQALRMAQNIGLRDLESSTYTNLARSADYLGMYDEAVTYARRALANLRDHGGRRGQCVVLTNLSLHTHHQGDNVTALAYGKRALELAQELENTHLTAYAWDFIGHAQTALGALDAAATAYRNALTVRQCLDQTHLVMESHAGLARVALARTDVSAAMKHGEAILTYVKEHSVEGTEEPLRIYLTVYRVLEAADDVRAPAILQEAHCLLQQRAGNIVSKEARRTFLENIATHRAIREIVEPKKGSTAQNDVYHSDNTGQRHLG